jgi:hypothetical protein
MLFGIQYTWRELGINLAISDVRYRETPHYILTQAGIRRHSNSLPTPGS